jgi:hypothetical protein
VPVLFLPDDARTRGLGRVRKALRPGGWMVLQVLRVPGTGLPPVLRLMCVLSGGEGRSPEYAASMLRDTGYEEVAVFPPLPGTPVTYAGRRPDRIEVRG